VKIVHGLKSWNSSILLYSRKPDLTFQSFGIPTVCEGFSNVASTILNFSCERRRKVSGEGFGGQGAAMDRGGESHRPKFEDEESQSKWAPCTRDLTDFVCSPEDLVAARFMWSESHPSVAVIDKIPFDRQPRTSSIRSHESSAAGLLSSPELAHSSSSSRHGGQSYALRNECESKGDHVKQERAGERRQPQGKKQSGCDFLIPATDSACNAFYERRHEDRYQEVHLLIELTGASEGFGNSSHAYKSGYEKIRKHAVVAGHLPKSTAS
jgi:hypothetical protein